MPNDPGSLDFAAGHFSCAAFAFSGSRYARGTSPVPSTDWTVLSMPPPRYLQQISLKGYKSIDSLESLPLNAGLNVLIGANGSGKSNFIRFFDLLRNIADPTKGLQNYVAQHGGADAFLFRGMKITPEFQAKLAFGSNRYEFTLKAADDRSLFFASEQAPFQGNYGPTWNDLGGGHRESLILRDTSPARTNSIKWARETIASWRSYHFHDTSANAPMMGRCNVYDHATLHGDASNIAAVLKSMETNAPERLDRIVEAIRLIAPFFGGFVLKEIAADQTRLFWKDRYCDLLYDPTQFSDGTARFACLATLLLGDPQAATIVIDEPELGLHPYAIKLLASMLKEAADSVQIILSTQSTLLLDEMDPENVIVVDQIEGKSLLRRLDGDGLDAWLEEYTLGQLWEKNDLGGVPR